MIIALANIPEPEVSSQDSGLSTNCRQSPE